MPDDRAGFQVSAFSEFAARLVDRLGLENADAETFAAFNEAVRAALTPAVSDILAIPSEGEPDLRAATGNGTRLPDTDAARLAVYTAALGQFFQDPDFPTLSAVLQIAQDIEDGAIDGRDRFGNPISNLSYDPLRFVELYVAGIEGAEDAFGPTGGFADDLTAGLSRFVARDPNCTSEFAQGFFAANTGILTFPVAAAEGSLANLVSGDSFQIDISADGISIPTMDGAINIGPEALQTCSRPDSASGGTGGLVRFLADLDGDGNLDELVFLGNGSVQPPNDPNGAPVASDNAFIASGTDPNSFIKLGDGDPSAGAGGGTGGDSGGDSGGGTGGGTGGDSGGGTGGDSGGDTGGDSGGGSGGGTGGGLTAQQRCAAATGQAVCIGATVTRNTVTTDIIHAPVFRTTSGGARVYRAPAIAQVWEVWVGDTAVTPGTYTCGVSGTRLRYNARDGSSQFDSLNTGSSCTITVTSNSGGFVEGTFSGLLRNSPGQFVTVENGFFRSQP